MAKTKNVYTTEWTGKYPNVCSGEWKLFKNGELVEVDIPFKNGQAETFNVYDEFSFNNDWEEIHRKYKDGLFCEDWCQKNKDWLKDIAPKDEWPLIFKAFQENDWRYGCCGGCI